MGTIQSQNANTSQNMVQKQIVVEAKNALQKNPKNKQQQLFPMWLFTQFFFPCHVMTVNDMERKGRL